MGLKKVFNKEKLKGMVIGSVITLLATSPLLIFAGSEAITAYLTDIKVLYNGKAVESDTKPIIYNGRTFLPVRALANSFDKNIDWNGETSTVAISDKVNKVEETVLPTKDIEDSKIKPELKDYDVLKFDNGNKYVGQVKDGKANGFGTMYNSQDKILSYGQWKNNMKGGFGFSFIDDYKYCGEFKDDVLNGMGFVKKENGIKLYGEYSQGMVNGLGLLWNTDGSYYAGGLSNSAFNGVGILKTKEDIFRGGQWENNVLKKVTVTSITNNTTTENNTQQNTSSSSINTNNTSTPQTQTVAPLSTKQQIQNYLTENFSTLETSLGKTSFTFSVSENTLSILPYDYSVHADYDLKFFFDLEYSNQYTKDQKEKVKLELKNHQEKLAKALINKFPNKKFEGGYLHGSYKYPSLKLGYESTRYYSWQNYEMPQSLTSQVVDAYLNSKLTNFIWYPNLDDEL